MAPLETPIVSTLDNVSEDETYGVFLLELGEGIDWVQEAELRGDMEEVAKRCDELAGDGRRYGLPPLAAAAAGAHAAATAADRVALRDALVVLTDVARRVRLGSTAL